MKVVIDTDALIGFYRSKRDREAFFEKEGITAYAISVVTYLEFLGGAQPERKKEARKFLSAFRVLPFPSRIFELTVVMASQVQLKKKGSSDILIAATALANGYAVVTRNVRDFENLGVEIVPYNP